MNSSKHAYEAVHFVFVTLIVILTFLIAFTLASRSAIAAGRATKEWLYWVDENKIFARPIWEVPMEIIDLIVDHCLVPAGDSAEILAAITVIQPSGEVVVLPANPKPSVSLPAQPISSIEDEPEVPVLPDAQAGLDGESDELAHTDDLARLNVRDLRTMARGKVKGFMKLSKAQLVEALR